jgi:hypothetical protein
MECAICYCKSNEEEDPRIKATFVTLPCEGTQYLNQKHTLCFHCFIANHTTSRGTCPVCRDNYMNFVGGPVELNEDNVSLASNFASPIPPPEVINWQDAEIYFEQQEQQEQQQRFEEENPVETFEEFARYVMEHLSYEPDDVLIITEPEPEQQQQHEHLNCCIVCGIDMGEENPRQYCEKTYCSEM